MAKIMLSIVEAAVTTQLLGLSGVSVENMRQSAWYLLALTVMVFALDSVLTVVFVALSKTCRSLGVHVLILLLAPPMAVPAKAR